MYKMAPAGFSETLVPTRLHEVTFYKLGIPFIVEEISDAIEYILIICLL
jgi:hypothetical protein